MFASTLCSIVNIFRYLHSLLDGHNSLQWINCRHVYSIGVEYDALQHVLSIFYLIYLLNLNGNCDGK